ncbi:MAG: glycosyltransferase family 2 protein [Clostridiales bacterium]|nr:glycosyltransferase family 2 protein [Clostridiales bacterium]
MSRVSVVIPTYQRGDFLPRAIESVLEQDYRDAEVVVVDDNGDGSPYREGTRAAVAPYLGGRVRYIQNARNLGGALARNVGIEAAAGEYITFLDDDDVYLPGKLSAQVAAMDEGGWDLSFMDFEYRDTGGRPLHAVTHDLPPHPDRRTLLRAHLIEHLTPTASYMFRAGALRAVGGFDAAHMAQEYLLMLKSIERGLSIGYVKRTGVANYVHPGERISTGPRKAAGEIELYELKRRHFGVLTPAERRYVASRHYATLFFVYFKRRELGRALVAGMRAAASPASAIRLLRERGAMMGSSPAGRGQPK